MSVTTQVHYRKYNSLRSTTDQQFQILFDSALSHPSRDVFGPSPIHGRQSKDHQRKIGNTMNVAMRICDALGVRGTYILYSPRATLADELPLDAADALLGG